MWKNPEWITGVQGKKLWDVLVLSDIEDWQIPAYPELRGSTEAHSILREATTSVLKAFFTAHNRVTGLSTSSTFCAHFDDTTQSLAHLIRKNRRYSLLPELWDAVEDAYLSLPLELWSVFQKVVWTTYLLLGDERRCLIGTKDNKPTWRPLARPITSRTQAEILGIGAVHDINLRYVQAGDESIVPALDEWVKEDLFQYPWPSVSMEAIHKLLEQAFYNQRYTIDPAGARVQLVGCPRINSLYLKVRRGIRDPNYYDFLARFELDNGSFFNVLDGVVGAVTGHSELDEMISRGTFLNYTYYLIAQIYHDLVTAIELPVARYRGGRIVRPQLEPKPTETVSGIYIPRVVRGNTELPRREIPSPRITEPHRVRGYKRKGKMTEAHRLEILKFEQTTGLKVLDWTPAGCTFVRPHVSPAADYEWLAHLPLFIRNRMQDALKRLLESPLTNDPPI